METPGWLNRATTFLGVQFTNRTWAVLISAVFWMLGFAALMLGSSSSNQINIWFIAIGIPGALVCLGLALYFSLPSGRFLVFLSLGLVIAALAIETYLLGSPFYSSFSPTTQLTLWLVFGALALAAYVESLPTKVIVILSPALAFGALVTVPYSIRIAPLMPFGWMAIPFAGIGLLVYTPVIAMAAFARCWNVGWVQVCRRGALLERRLMAVLSVVAIAGFLAVVFGVRREITTVDEAGRARLRQMSAPYSSVKDLPAWLLLTGGSEPSVALSYMVGGFDSGWILDNARGVMFDVFVHVASLGLDPWPLWSMEGDTWTRLASEGKLSPEVRRLIVEQSTRLAHAGVRTQVFPKQHLAYTELDIQVESSSSDESVANMLIEIPSGSVASSLALWIDGQERAARFSLRGKASQAFNTIVNKKRDPALLEWMDDRHLRLQVFPVSRVLPRRVKIGYVTPLDGEQAELEYRGPMVSGIRQNGALELVTVEVFSDHPPLTLKSGLDFKPLNVAMNAARPFEAETVPGKSWSFRVGQEQVSPRGKSSWTPQAIVFVPRGVRNQTQWAHTWTNLHTAFPNAKMGAFGEHLSWLTTPHDLTRPIQEGQTMRGLPIPFYGLEMLDPSHTLFVVEDDGTKNLLTIRGSGYFHEMSSFFRNHPGGLNVLSLDEKPSAFFSGLSELDLATVFRYRDGALQSVPSPIASVRREQAATDFADRLTAYKQSMRLAVLEDDQGIGTPDKLASEMRRRQLVTPFSSLIVLESERDYELFGIDDRGSEKNNTRPADPSLRESLGLVPEPHEYLLLAICLAAIAYIYRRRSTAVLG